jgi:hypothetical protein
MRRARRSSGLTLRRGRWCGSNNLPVPCTTALKGASTDTA